MACDNPGTCSDCVSGCNVTCDICQKCDDGCKSECESAQTYNDKKISEIFSNFSFSITPVKDVTIMGPDANKGYFNKAIWDEITKWLSKRNHLPIDELREDTDDCYDWVKENNADGGDEVALSTVANVSPFKASEFNRISEIVGGATVRVNDLIEASLFTDLVTKANAKTVDDGACKHCVTACDLTCDSCQKCDEGCQDGCNACQGCVACNTDCDTCNSCDSGEGCDGGCESDEGCVGAVAQPL